METEPLKTLLREGTHTLSMFFFSREKDPRTPILSNFFQAFREMDRVHGTEIRAFDAQDSSPFLAFSWGTAPARHFYQAVPTGLKEEPFLSLVRHLTRRQETGLLSPKTEEILRALTRPLTIQVLIGPSCPFCSRMTDRVNRFAVVGRLIRSWIIDVELFPEYGQRYRIQAVPATIIEKESVLTGMVDEEDLALWLKRWDEGRLGPALYRQDLLEKRLDQALDRLRRCPKDLPFVAALLRDDAFGVKLGAMALLEQLGEEETNLHGRIWDALVPLLDDPSPQVVGDAAYLLGLLSDERKIPTLRKLLHHPQPEVAEIAREGLAEKA